MARCLQTLTFAREGIEALALAGALDKHFGTVGHTPDRISATFTVGAKDVRGALERSRVIFEKATINSVSPALLIDEVEAVEHGRLAGLLSNPRRPGR